MLRTIRGMALAVLAIHLLLDVRLFGGIVTRSPVGPYLYDLYSPLLYWLYVTSSLLAFALGVVTLVAAAQHRRRRWFVPLLPLTVLVGYASGFYTQLIYSLIYAFSPMAYPGRIQVRGPQPDLAVIYIPLLILALPAALALTALAYTGHIRAWAAAQTGAPSDREEAEDQLEVSSIDLPLDGTR